MKKGLRQSVILALVTMFTHSLFAQTLPAPGQGIEDNRWFDYTDNQPTLNVGKNYLLIEGDVLRIKEENSTTEGQDPLNPVITEGLFVTSPAKLWAQGIVPYVFDKGTHPSNIEIFKEYIQRFNDEMANENIPVKMVQRQGHKKFVTIIFENGFANRGWFSSFNGLATIGSQSRNYLLVNSFSRPTFYHELMHVLGSFHEHSRRDRDQFVEINPNYDPSIFYDDYDFAINASGFHVGPYDIESITHYSVVASDATFSSGAFFRAREGVELKDLYFGRTFLSKLDLKGLRTVYSDPEVANAEIPMISAVEATEAPGFTSYSVLGSAIQFTWNEPDSFLPIVAYEVFKNDERVAYIPNVKLMSGLFVADERMYVDVNVKVGKKAKYKVRAVDEIGSRGKFSSVRRLGPTGQSLSSPSAVPVLNAGLNRNTYNVKVTWEASQPADQVYYKVRLTDLEGVEIKTVNKTVTQHVFSLNAMDGYFGLINIEVTPVKNNGVEGRTRTVSIFNDTPRDRLHPIKLSVQIPDSKYNIMTSNGLTGYVVTNGKYCKNPAGKIWPKNAYPVEVLDELDGINMDAVITGDLDYFEGTPCMVQSDGSPSDPVLR